MTQDSRISGAAGKALQGAVAGTRRLVAPLLGVQLRDDPRTAAPEESAIAPAASVPAAVTSAPPIMPATASAAPPLHPVPMAERLAAWRAGEPLPLALTGQAHARIRGRDVTFCLNIARDPIQNCHRAGKFYEQTELDALTALLPAAATVLDIGANIGNHALYLALFAGAARIVVIEPNPLALEALVGNVLANRLEGVIDLDHLGFGLGEADSAGWGMKPHDRNLGATKMQPGKGALQVRRGDDVFPDLMPDLVKIDVEGMEMEVLAGLEALIARARPILLVEVEHDRQIAFLDWARARSYRPGRPGRHNDKKANFLLQPEALPGPDRTDPSKE